MPRNELNYKMFRCDRALKPIILVFLSTLEHQTVLQIIHEVLIESIE